MRAQAFEEALAARWHALTQPRQVGGADRNDHYPPLRHDEPPDFQRGHHRSGRWRGRWRFDHGTGGMHRSGRRGSRSNDRRFAGWRQSASVMLQASKRLVAARLHPRAVGHEVRSAGMPDGFQLRLRRLVTVRSVLDRGRLLLHRHRRRWRRGRSGRRRRGRCCRLRTRRRRRCARHDRAHCGPAGRRQLGYVPLQAFKSVLTARLHAGAVGHEVGSAGMPDGIGLARRGLLRVSRGRRGDQQRSAQRRQCVKLFPARHRRHPPLF